MTFYDLFFFPLIIMPSISIQVVLCIDNPGNRIKSKKKNSKMMDIRLLIEKAHVIKGMHHNERKRPTSRHIIEVLEPGIRRSLKSF